MMMMLLPILFETCLHMIGIKKKYVLCVNPIIIKHEQFHLKYGIKVHREQLVLSEMSSVFSILQSSVQAVQICNG